MRHFIITVVCLIIASVSLSAYELVDEAALEKSCEYRQKIETLKYLQERSHIRAAQLERAGRLYTEEASRHYRYAQRLQSLHLDEDYVLEMAECQKIRNQANVCNELMIKAQLNERKCKDMIAKYDALAYKYWCIAYGKEFNPYTWRDVTGR